MKNKYRVLLKSIVFGVIAGAVGAAMVYGACTIYIRGLNLDVDMASFASGVRRFMSVAIGITCMLAFITARLGREEKKDERNWHEQNRQMAKDFNSDIKGVNLAGLIDDTQGKEFSTLFGERIKVGEDHGTFYMISKTLMLFSLFITISSSLIMICMLISLK